MQSSLQIHAELDRCTQILDRLNRSQSLEEVEEHWKEFLSRLERVWYKCESHFKRSPKWNGWKGKYEKYRKIDPVLAYLINARGAHEHTVEEIVKKDPGSISIGAGNEGSVRIKRLMVADGKVEFEGDGDLLIQFNPAELKPVLIVNRGRDYPVPNEHMGIKLADNRITTIASLGLNFYKKVVLDTEAFLVCR